METLLVAGAETMVGANFAAQLAEQLEVTACFTESPRTISGCQSVACPADDAKSIRTLLDDVGPQRLVYCCAGSDSAWEEASRPAVRHVARAERWFAAAKAADLSVTVISSDAVFTGPWMFHAENSLSLCPSPEAQCLRAIETMAQEILPECLILRSNPYGWSSRWLEKLLEELEAGHAGRLDCVRHASPILVNDLIDIATKSWQGGLDGVYHVGGAERTNPAAFAQRLAAEFGLKCPRPQATESLTDRTTGFGQSETSLQTRKIRRALGVSVPLLGEGLKKLRQLSLNGFRDRLHPTTEKLPPARVA